MWMKLVVGGALCLIGALWFAQGIGTAKGSPMTGHAQWAWIGGALVVIGLVLILWAVATLSEEHRHLTSGRGRAGFRRCFAGQQAITAMTTTSRTAGMVPSGAEACATVNQVVNM